MSTESGLISFVGHYSYHNVHYTCNILLSVFYCFLVVFTLSIELTDRAVHEATVSLWP